MKSRYLFLSLVAWALVAGQAVASEPCSLIVIPARMRTVKLALDVVNLRSPALVSYAVTSASPDPQLFLWAANQWKPISVGQFKRGEFLPKKPAVVFLVGGATAKDIPAVLVDSAAVWGTDVRRTDTSNIGDLATAFDKAYHFSGYEWKTLADNNGLTITDTNAERRRYGRYGKPGASQPSAPPVAPALPPQIQPVTEIPAVVPPAIAAPAMTSTGTPTKVQTPSPKVNPADK